MLFIVLLNHIGFCCSFFLHKLSWDEFQMWFIQLLSISHFSAIDFTYVAEFQTKIWWTYCPVSLLKVRYRKIFKYFSDNIEVTDPASCLASNAFVILSWFPRIRITMVHIFILKSYFYANKGEKSTGPLGELKRFFIFHPKVQLWSYKRHMCIHPSSRIYPFKNESKIRN